MSKSPLTDQQVAEYELPEAVGNKDDPRADGFFERHGKLVQVEVEALPPDLLRALFQKAINQYWDLDIYNEVMNEEHTERTD